MLEVESTVQHVRSPLFVTVRAGRNGNEAVAGAALEAFVRRLHHRYVLRRTTIGEGAAYRFAVRCLVCDGDVLQDERSQVLMTTAVVITVSFGFLPISLSLLARESPFSPVTLNSDL